MAETAAERQSAIQSMPVFPLIPYDVEACITARVLIAGSEDGKNSPGAAAYRMLRTRILQRARSNSWNTIGVTSPGQGDGKSITAINLALAAAREGNNNVFLIDLDMRNPKVCQYLGVAPDRNINDYFTEDAAAKDVMFSIGVDNLSVAGTLKRTDRASELLATGRVEELFQYVRGVAPEPLIIVDLPPLLSTDDAIIIAPKVDACLLVLSEGKSRRDGAAQALDLLSEYALAGIVLNRSHATVADYYSS
ncbi:MAG: CpsD/CapB family tyrosine-protein kinase [Gammaproteobacteria bacterium]